MQTNNLCTICRIKPAEKVEIQTGDKCQACAEKIAIYRYKKLAATLFGLGDYIEEEKEKNET